ncbi:glycosyl hydrolase [Aspergillus crustosus]
MLFTSSLGLATVALSLLRLSVAQSNTFVNPVIPGWHSDPSCIQIDGTYLCVTSTFIAFPGLPVYASKDLINWKLASHVWNRQDQLPDMSWDTPGQQDGMYAATIRYRDGIYYVICEYLGTSQGLHGVLFKSTDPFSDEGWSDPVTFQPGNIDPDLFWDDDGSVWVATAGISLRTIDLETGQLGEDNMVWGGTGGVAPEGPHIYKKDGWYYLMIAEGGTNYYHSITIARSQNILGPYESYEQNPILTNRGTGEYFEFIGHGDLFQDPSGNWWGACLGVRLGEQNSMPMGRETFLFNATWNEGQWPMLQPVRGRMPGDSLPTQDLNVDGKGPFVTDDDNYTFQPGSAIPPHFLYWRTPRDGGFSVTLNGLEIVPTRNNLTGIPGSAEQIELSGQRGLAFIGRRQTHTLFNFYIDVSFDPQADNQEAGVTIFRTQLDHIDLGILRRNSEMLLRFKAEGSTSLPQLQEIPVPDGWEDGNIRLQIAAKNATHFEFSAIAGDFSSEVYMGTAAAAIVSGGAGEFVGSLLGAYATCNGEGSGEACPDGGNTYVVNWVYEGISQQIDHDEFYP